MIGHMKIPMLAIFLIGDVRVGSYFEEAANPICWKPL
jgi:hypothetical protein